MAAIFGWFSEARVWASRVQPGEPFSVARERVGQDFERDVTMQRRIPGPIHLPHAPFTNVGDDS